MYSLPFLHTEAERLDFFKALKDNAWFVEETKQLDYGKVYTLEKGEGQSLLSYRFVLYAKKNGTYSKIVIEKGNDELYNEFLKLEKSLSHMVLKEEKSSSFVHRPVLEIPEYDERIGSDESGKGDLFGPLVVAAVCLSKEDEDLLLHLPISDSKSHTDSVNLKTKKSLLEILKPSRYSIKMLMPLEYNSEYAKYKNQAVLLSHLHSIAIEEVLSKNPACTHIIVDQFSGTYRMENSLRAVLNEKMTLFQTPKGERDMAVGAASILARSTFVETLHKMSERVGYEILPGVSEKVKGTATQILKEKGEDILKTIAKTHFSCYPKSITK